MSSRGFTLVETLMALLVLTGFAVVFSSGVIGSWRAVAIAEGDKRALMLARSVIEAVGTSDALVESAYDRTDSSGLTYGVTIRPHKGQQDSDLSAYWVTVTVYNKSATAAPRATLVLQTLKLARRND